MKRFLLPLFLILGSTLSAQQLPADNPSRLVIDSKVMGEKRPVLVRTPPAYARGETRYPVLYLTDGDRQLANAVATIEFLSREGRMPEMIVVGISNTDRARDLTPTRLDSANFDGQQFRMPNNGGADRFLNFIESELIPTIEGQYRTLPYRVFSGHSFGGLFAMHSMVSRPRLFNAWIAVSPTFQWDDNYINRRATEFFKDKKELRGTLFFTVGDEGAINKQGYESLKRLLSRKAPKGFEWGAMEWLDEDHGSVVMPSHYHGLRKVFEGWRLVLASGDPSVLSDQAVKHYSKVSQRLGYTVAVPEGTTNLIGYRLLQANKPQEAVVVFMSNVAAYPNSANVYDSLGEAYEKAGELNKASESYARAAAIGEKTNDPNTGVFKQNQERVIKALEAAGKTAGRS